MPGLSSMGCSSPDRSLVSARRMEFGWQCLRTVRAYAQFRIDGLQLTRLVASFALRMEFGWQCLRTVRAYARFVIVGLQLTRPVASSRSTYQSE